MSESLWCATFAVHYRRAMQKRHELAGLLALLRSRAPMKVVLEIGGMHGGTLWAWEHGGVLTPDAQLVCIDLYVLDGRLEHAPARTQHLLSDSHDPATLADVTAKLVGPVDMLFIDGDHSLPGVTADFEMYSPLVRRGGLVVLHDTAMPHETVERHQIIPFWEKLQREYETLQIFDSIRDPEWGGIGVVFF